MVVCSRRAQADLVEIEAADGGRTVIMLLQWCARLEEASTRAEAERMSSEEIFRLRVSEYYIIFRLVESGDDDRVEISRIRRRRDHI